MCQFTLLCHQWYSGALLIDWCVLIILIESFGVKGGGGSDDMFFNSLVNIVGVCVCV